MKLCLFFRKMARDISLVCNFIFGSIQTGLMMDTVDVELMIRTVKASIHIENTIQMILWCSHHGAGP